MENVGGEDKDSETEQQKKSEGSSRMESKGNLGRGGSKKVLSPSLVGGEAKAASPAKNNVSKTHVDSVKRTSSSGGSKRQRFKEVDDSAQEVVIDAALDVGSGREIDKPIVGWSSLVGRFQPSMS